MNKIQQPVWKVNECSRNQIIKAGKTIRKNSATQSEIDEATMIIDYWRAAHGFPLFVIYMFIRRMAMKKAGFIPAQRLKRLDSIINKLKREPTMSLWNIQDLGGCRLIVPSIYDVYESIDTMKKSRIRHILLNENDYIQNPKTSGYRSVHLVYQYHSDKVETYNRNMLIEVQFRTHLQLKFLL